MSKDTLYREDAIKAEVPDRVQIIRKEIERLCENCERPTEEETKEKALELMAFGFSVGLTANRPQGSWESWWNEDLSRWGARCTSCHKWSSAYFDFCPNCGCRMKGADDER